MHLSILIASNRAGLLACSRIVQACSWAGPDVEVLIRDNSGNTEKRELLSCFRRDHCHVIIAEPCDGLTNFSEILRLAKGEFIFLLADDDFAFDQAIGALPGVIGQFGKDPAVAGVTGTYAVEAPQGTSLVSYQDIEADDVVKRVCGFLNYGGPNILQYAPVRRQIVQRVFAFMTEMPLYFSFHDQIHCLLYLLSGKYIRLNRLLYLYDVGVWASSDTAQRRDVDFYRAAGLDASVNALHWFLCGFEGAALVKNSDLFPACSPAQRQAIADRWFATMFVRFKGNRRMTFGSSHATEADKLCAKLRSSTGQLSFHGMLAEISTFMARSSKPQAEKYFDFWEGVLSRRSVAVASHG